MSKSSHPPNWSFEDGNGTLFTGTAAQIVGAMRHIEWGDTPPVLEWKERVRMRASAFGYELEFYDALSFLDALERHGLGRFIPLANSPLSESPNTKSTESGDLTTEPDTKSNESGTMNPESGASEAV